MARTTSCSTRSASPSDKRGRCQSERGKWTRLSLPPLLGRAANWIPSRKFPSPYWRVRRLIPAPQRTFTEFLERTAHDCENIFLVLATTRILNKHTLRVSKEGPARIVGQFHCRSIRASWPPIARFMSIWMMSMRLISLVPSKFGSRGNRGTPGIRGGPRGIHSRRRFAPSSTAKLSISLP